MQQNLNQNISRFLESDVIIIGGGATGAGIARDCALRGFKATLLETRYRYWRNR